MASKNITITKEAYNYLKKLKGKDMSFSEAILSLKARRQSIMKYAGSMKREDLKSIEKVREDMRKEWRERTRDWC